MCEFLQVYLLGKRVHERMTMDDMLCIYLKMRVFTVFQLCGLPCSMWDIFAPILLWDMAQKMPYALNNLKQHVF